MTATARLNQEYAWRMLGVGTMMVCLAGWALYDGVIAYPRMNTRYEAVRPELVARELTAGEWVKPAGEEGLSLFEQAFKERGIALPKTLFTRLRTLREQVSKQTVQPEQVAVFREQQLADTHQLLEQPLKSEQDIRSQFVMAILAGLAAVMAFVAVGRKAGRRVTAAAEGIQGLAASVVPYADIASLDWARWEGKRIICFLLRDGRRLTLDGWHYKGTEEVVAMVLHHRPDLSSDVSASVHPQG